MKSFKEKIFGPLNGDVLAIMSETISVETESKLRIFIAEEKKNRREPGYSLCK